jgi:hypothetical protein
MDSRSTVLGAADMDGRGVEIDLLPAHAASDFVVSSSPCNRIEPVSTCIALFGRRPSWPLSSTA